jgi:hypothetical protein
MSVGEFLQVLKHDDVLCESSALVSTDTESVWVTEPLSGDWGSESQIVNSHVSQRVVMLAEELFGLGAFQSSVAHESELIVTTITPDFPMG